MYKYIDISVCVYILMYVLINKRLYRKGENEELERKMY